MNIFSKILDKLFGSNNEKSKAIPGAMGNLLFDMGIHEIGPYGHAHSGIPDNVARGCKKEYVLIPGMSRPAMRKNGEPMFSKDKRGKQYQVMDQYAVSKKLWKKMQNDQKRKAEGRWYSGATVAA